MSDNKIIRTIIPQQVRIRKYDIDIELLKILLKKYKSQSKLTINQISSLINKPKTMVEHWFRKDNSFSIPDEDIWFELKKILGITDNSFDESIMTFEIRNGLYEKSNRVYDTRGIAPTLTSTSAEFERYIIWE